jgi:Domain of unknown function (DUF4158)
VSLNDIDSITTCLPGVALQADVTVRWARRSQRNAPAWRGCCAAGLEIRFGVQLGTVRYLGTFLADPVDVPTVVVDYFAEQLGIADASCIKAYGERPKTAYEHAC